MDHEPITAADIYDAIRAGRITGTLCDWLVEHGYPDYAASLWQEKMIREGLA